MATVATRLRHSAPQYRSRFRPSLALLLLPSRKGYSNEHNLWLPKSNLVNHWFDISHALTAFCCDIPRQAGASDLLAEFESSKKLQMIYDARKSSTVGSSGSAIDLSVDEPPIDLSKDNPVDVASGSAGSASGAASTSQPAASLVGVPAALLADAPGRERLSRNARPSKSLNESKLAKPVKALADAPRPRPASRASIARNAKRSRHYGSVSDDSSSSESSSSDSDASGSDSSDSDDSTKKSKRKTKVRDKWNAHNVQMKKMKVQRAFPGLAVSRSGVGAFAGQSAPQARSVHYSALELLCSVCGRSPLSQSRTASLGRGGRL